MSQVLVTRNLCKFYKSNFQISRVKALDEVSFSVNRGDVFGFIGHNGAGKTTAIKILTGLIRASSGEATVMGRPVGDPASLIEVGFLPERPYFYEYLSAREALGFYGRLSGMDRAKIKQRAGELLEMLDLTEAADRPMISYSKGMLQRFGVAQALIHDPHLVILDEPMSGLDPVGRGQIKEIIQLLKERGKTVFFSTHILSDVEQLCDQVALIARGRLWYSGTVDELTGRYEQGTEFTLRGVDPQKQTFWQALEGELTMRPDGRGILNLPLGRDPQDVLKTLLAEGIQVEKLLPRRTSLEEIFVREFRKEEEASRARDSDRT